jgi:hypothetical protein
VKLPDFGLNREQEDLYRRRQFAGDLSLARECAALMLGVLLIFSVMDYQFFGLSGHFYRLQMLQLSLAAGTVSFGTILVVIAALRGDPAIADNPGASTGLTSPSP